MGQRTINIIRHGGQQIALSADWAKTIDEKLTVYEVVPDGPTTSPASEIVGEFAWNSIVGYHWLPSVHPEGA